MKALGALILLVLVGYVGYQYAYQPIADFIGLEKPKPPVLEIPQPVIVKVEPPPPPPVKMEEPTPVMPKPPEPKPEPPPMPKIAEGMGASVPKPDSDGFMPPTFPPLEEVVKNWTEIPRGAFMPPRPVKLLKPVEFVATINGNKFGSKVQAGGDAVVLGQDGGNLIIATSPTAPAKAQVPIDDTDLKAVLTAVYESWKVRMTEMKHREFLFAKNASSRAADPKAGPAAAAPAGAPKKNGEGSYDVLLASMKAGQVTEITPTNVKKWGDVVQEKIDGKDYFTIIVDYTTKTMFGDFDTQAQARIGMDGRVEKWIYTGSGEVVP